MGFYRGPNIVTDGLVFAVDAGSERSYPGSGTTATDLAGANTVALVNGVSLQVQIKEVSGVLMELMIR